MYVNYSTYLRLLLRQPVLLISFERFLKDPEYAAGFLDDPGCFAMNSRGLERNELTNELIQERKFTE